MGLLAGMHVDAHALVEDWRTQVHLETLERYHTWEFHWMAFVWEMNCVKEGMIRRYKAFYGALVFWFDQVIERIQGVAG